MSVMPAACKVTAVVKMMKKATRLANAMPIIGVPADTAELGGPSAGWSISGSVVGSASSSSTSSDAAKRGDRG